jgi:SAM-dependent methyltransferase
LTTHDPEELFRSTAPYYARYRPGYPSELFSCLAEIQQLDGTQEALDLGCGTGQIAIPLAASVNEVAAVDPQPDMLEWRQHRAAEEGVDNDAGTHEGPLGAAERAFGKGSYESCVVLSVIDLGGLGIALRDVTRRVGGLALALAVAGIALVIGDRGAVHGRALSGAALLDAGAARDVVYALEGVFTVSHGFLLLLLDVGSAVPRSPLLDSLASTRRPAGSGRGGS